MNLLENVKVALGSIRENALRTTLTALIIAIGIFALVGILTAVDGIQSSINSSFADLGANSFDIEQKNSQRNRRRGRDSKQFPPIEYHQAIDFKEKMSLSGAVCLSAFVSPSAEVKFGSKKTNPNTFVTGGDENYLAKAGLNLQAGRNFSMAELQAGAYVVILGSGIVETVFEKQSPVNQMITMQGAKYKVIGVLEKKGSNFGGGSDDRAAIVPLENARAIAPMQLTFDLNVRVFNPAEMAQTMDQAHGLMRLIRKDKAGTDDSFELKKSETLANSFDEISGYMKIAGGLVGFITLLGASIGLMNIMLVSVTERTKEIGTRMALGATPRRIQQQFLIEAIVICQLGGFLGIVLGIISGNLVSLALGSSGFIVPWVWMLLGVLVCVVVGVISGFYPSYKASKLDPIEALRFE